MVCSCISLSDANVSTCHYTGDGHVSVSVRPSSGEAVSHAATAGGGAPSVSYGTSSLLPSPRYGRSRNSSGDSATAAGGRTGGGGRSAEGSSHSGNSGDFLTQENQATQQASGPSGEALTAEASLACRTLWIPPQAIRIGSKQQAWQTPAGVPIRCSEYMYMINVQPVYCT